MENPGYDTNPDRLGDEIVADARAIESWVADRRQRGSDESATLRKVVSRTANMTAKYSGSNALINAPLTLHADEAEGIAVGMGQASGRIVGFIWNSYPVLNEQLEVEQEVEGVSLVLSTLGINTTMGSRKHWEKMFDASVVDEIENADTTLPILIPLVDGVRIQWVPRATEPFWNAEDVIARSSEGAEAYDYMTYVKRIQKMTADRALWDFTDRAVLGAVQMEIDAMVSNCPYLGRKVKFESNNMRSNHPTKPGGKLKLAGEVEGVLRKFIYSHYQEDGQFRGSVQAVVYTPEAAQLVQGGEITPEDADNKFDTIFVILSKPHKLTVLN